jgi:hypothetical protein
MRQPIAFLLVLLLAFGCQQKPTFMIPEGRVGMFGYGSLMSKRFIESSLLEKNYDGPFLSAHVNGYRRAWTFAWPSTLPSLQPDGRYYRDYVLAGTDTIYPPYLHYLNIQEEAGSVINGVLYLVPESDLSTYDDWELGYERFEITDRITDYTITGGPVYAYRALPEFTREPTKDYRISVVERGYVTIIDDAFLFWGDAFKEEYIKSTIAPDPAVIQATTKVEWKNPPLEKIEALKASFKHAGGS